MFFNNLSHEFSKQIINYHSGSRKYFGYVVVYSQTFGDANA